jgi:hypothetical protein
VIRKGKPPMLLRPRFAAALLALTLFGCTSTATVEPGDGPAASEPAASEPGHPEDSIAPHPTEPPVDEQSPPPREPSDATEPPPGQAASCKEKWVYEDGLEVEVIRIQTGRFTAQQAQDGMDGEKKGDPHAKFTVRVRNGSKKTVELNASATVVYGSDGIEAVKSYAVDSDSGLTGKLLPGKARSSAAVYLSPESIFGDVVLEFNADFEHEAAMFGGSIR